MQPLMRYVDMLSSNTLEMDVFQLGYSFRRQKVCSLMNQPLDSSATKVQPSVQYFDEKGHTFLYEHLRIDTTVQGISLAQDFLQRQGAGKFGELESTYP